MRAAAVVPPVSQERAARRRVGHEEDAAVREDRLVDVRRDDEVRTGVQPQEPTRIRVEACANRRVGRARELGDGSSKPRRERRGNVWERRRDAATTPLRHRRAAAMTPQQRRRDAATTPPRPATMPRRCRRAAATTPQRRRNDAATTPPRRRHRAGGRDRAETAERPSTSARLKTGRRVHVDVERRGARLARRAAAVQQKDAQNRQRLDDVEQRARPVLRVVAVGRGGAAKSVVVDRPY